MILTGWDILWPGCGPLRGLRWKQLSLRRIRLYATPKSMNSIYKLIDVPKLLVHRGVAQIRYFIDRAPLFEHFGADYGCRNLTPTRSKFIHKLIHTTFQGPNDG